MKKFWKVFLDIITFSYPQYRLAFFSIVILLLLFIPTSVLETNHTISVNAILFKPLEGKCISFLKHDYCDYPSKGITRGVSSILHLDFEKAYNYNPISFLVLLTMFGIMIYDIFYLMKKRK